MSKREEAKLQATLRAAERVRLTCNCTNWMGGCKREFGCNYGEVLSVREALEELINEQKPAPAPTPREGAAEALERAAKRFEHVRFGSGSPENHCRPDCVRCILYREAAKLREPAPTPIHHYGEDPGTEAIALELEARREGA